MREEIRNWTLPWCTLCLSSTTSSVKVLFLTNEEIGERQVTKVDEAKLALEILLCPNLHRRSSVSWNHDPVIVSRVPGPSAGTLDGFTAERVISLL